MTAAALASSAALAGAACAQGNALDRRVGDVTTGAVQFHFASREATCGDGRSFLRTDENSWYGSYINTSDPGMHARCERGPVRVVLTLAEREVVRLETYVGPLDRAEDATDLGAVPAREASAWLLGLAARGDGRPARDALLPAMLADSAAPTPGLLAIARDQDRPRETRRSAIGWLARSPDASSAEAARALAGLARDERDAPAVRQQALSTLGRLPRGAGIATLAGLAGERSDAWLGREAMRALGRSGDPRAREELRRAVADARLPDEVRAAAIAGLGNDLATGADARLLRDAYRTLANDRTKDATLAALATVGGAANAGFLLGVARDRDEAAALRRRAIQLSARAGATGAELARLYDEVEETDARQAVIGALGAEGSRPAREKLVAIAKSSELAVLRRRAIAQLERMDGPEVRAALAGIVNP